MMNELVSKPKAGPIAHPLLLSSKIQPKHLEKLALIYVRQSSQKQVEQNIESTQLQYRLAGSNIQWLAPYELVLSLEA
jgi:hypothetical protein